MKNRFPLYSLDPRHSAPLRNRWVVFARWSVLRSLKNWQARLASEVDSGFNMVTLLKLQDADMFVAAMRSLSLVRRTLPPVFVVCDREEDLATLKEKLDRHLVGVVVTGPCEVRRGLVSNSRNVSAEK